MENLESIYTDIIMEHSMSKHNKYKLENADKKEHGHNPNCGDDITLEIKYNGNKIEELAFTGHGCAISQASTSIMIDLLKGKTKEEAITLINLFLKMIEQEKIENSELKKIEDAIALKNVSSMPARVKCAELAWHTMKKLLKD